MTEVVIDVQLHQSHKYSMTE